MLKLWDAGSGRVLHTLTGHTSDVNSVTFSPDGRTLASASLDTTLKLWDATSGWELRTLTGHTGCVRSVAISPDGRTLASASADEYAQALGWSDRPGAAHPSPGTPAVTRVPAVSHRSPFPRTAAR